ncbi:fimbrillin family protein [Bacteroides ndongoniae]|uniref:fimbrillin family protein n=1 Tax=Bacteroides ndongoniae TaxID=1903262 RepID=UPI0023F77785|nr:fimbrillin family protein [Bacteroides ndongoniae]
MNKIYTILFCCVGLLTIFSCTQQDDAFMLNNESNYLQLSTEIVTRGIVESTTFNVGDEIGVCVTEADNTHEYADGSYNIRATYNGSSWVMDQKVILTDKAAKVRAYYPYDSEAMYGHLDINLNAVDGADDYLVGSATATVDMNSPVAHIEFKHILTRLTLAISCSEGEHLLNSVLLRSASNTLWAVASYSLLYGSDYAYNGGRSKDKHYIKKEVNATVNETRPQTVDILVYPIEGEEGDYMLEVTLDGKPYIISLPAVNWEAGQQYTYPIDISNVEQTEPVREAVYMGFDGDDGQPLYWATYNLGATSPEDYGGLYGWGDPTGEHLEQSFSDSERYGYYMSNKEECLALYGGETPLADISGTEYDVVRAMWGADWRMPTSSEFSRLNTNCTFVWTTLNGVKGALFTSNINGNSIFLPCGTTRRGTYISDNTDDTSSTYWTSTLNDEEVERASVFVFYDSGNAWIGRGAERYVGLPIRPVTSNPE